MAQNAVKRRMILAWSRIRFFLNWSVVSQKADFLLSKHGVVGSLSVFGSTPVNTESSIASLSAPLNLMINLYQYLCWQFVY